MQLIINSLVASDLPARSSIANEPFCHYLYSNEICKITSPHVYGSLQRRGTVTYSTCPDRFHYLFIFNSRSLECPLTQRFLIYRIENPTICHRLYGPEFLISPCTGHVIIYALCLIELP